MVGRGLAKTCDLRERLARFAEEAEPDQLDDALMKTVSSGWRRRWLARVVGLEKLPQVATLSQKLAALDHDTGVVLLAARTNERAP